MKNKNRVAMRKGLVMAAAIISLAIWTSCESSAQTIVLEQDVNADTSVSNLGRNRKHYFGSFAGIATIPGQTEGDTGQLLQDGKSLAISYGNYYKYKVSNLYSMLLSIQLRSSKFEFEKGIQQSYNRLLINELMGEWTHRFNYGQRGNYIGKYIEFGFSADYTVSNKLKIKTKPDNPNIGYKVQKEVYSNLSHLNKFNYSGHVRVGFNKLVLTADLRMSDLTNDKSTITLPPLNFGLRFDMGA